MTSVIERGSQSFLHQAQRNNWQLYLASLAAPSAIQDALHPAPPLDAATLPGSGVAWDMCVLTASDERQADMVRQQLSWRRMAGLLPARTEFHVVADPEGRRIGSGGATLRILAALFPQPGVEPEAGSLASLQPLAQVKAQDKRVLIIHSGGDSRRLPHCSATGKLFARIPRELPNGRSSTIFDEFLINLSGIAAGAPPGVLLVSGDVLLVFDHLQLSFRRHGVTGVSVASPAAMGRHHGVYVSVSGKKDVYAFLHKPSAELLAQWNAVDAGKVQIDTGLVWFDVSTAQNFASLAQAEPVADLCGLLPGVDPHKALAPLNLYGDLLLPLAQRDRACRLSAGCQRRTGYAGIAGCSAAYLESGAQRSVHGGTLATGCVCAFWYVGRVLADGCE